MKEAKQNASGTFLRQSVQEMKRIQQGNYTLQKHNRKSYLEEKAEQYFSMYLDDKLQIAGKDTEAFASYIDCFAIHDREKLWGKLQGETGFDLRAKMQKSERRMWWQKLWYKDDLPYLNTEKLVRKINRFERMQHAMNAHGFHGTALSNRIDDMAAEALRYIEAYNQGVYQPKAADIPAFVSYVKATGQFYENSPAEQALQKLAGEKGKIVPMHKPSKRRFSIKHVAMTAMLVVSAWLGFGSDAGQSEKAQDMPQQPMPSFVKLPTVSKYAMPKPTDYSLSAFIKQTPVQEAAPKVIVNSAEQQELIPFYTKRLSDFTSAKRAQKQITDMALQVQKGMIDLPQDVSVQKYLYAQEVYRRYGFKKIAAEMGTMLKSSQKLSAEQQSKLFNYARQAGKKGDGVQQMSQRMQRNNLWQVKASRGRAMV